MRNGVLRMYKRLMITAFGMVLAGSAAMAARAVIGLVADNTGVTIDNSRVAGGASLFDGSKVQSATYARFHLANGARLDLGNGASAQVYANRVALESGVGEVAGSSSFEIDARTLRIQSVGPTGIARVRMEADNRVSVTAVNGPVNVRNGVGVLVARVFPSVPMSFLPQGAASTAFEMTGCILQKGSAALLSDIAGNQIVEIRGKDFRKAIGNQYRVMGTAVAGATPAGGASQVINVSSATQTAKGGCGNVATKVGASATLAAASLGAAATTGGAVAAGAVAGAAAGGAAAAAGISTTALVVGGVAAATAATVGGLAASGVIGSTSP